MKPIYIAGLILLALTLSFAVIGMLLAGVKKIRIRHATSYTRVCALVVLAAAYGLTQFEWPGVHLRQVDFWSILVIVGIVAYACIWGAVAYQINQVGHEEFGHSFMLSMLYTDAEQGQQQKPIEKSSSSPAADPAASVTKR